MTNSNITKKELAICQALIRLCVKHNVCFQPLTHYISVGNLKIMKANEKEVCLLGGQSNTKVVDVITLNTTL